MPDEDRDALLEQLREIRATVATMQEALDERHERQRQRAQQIRAIGDRLPPLPNAE